MVLDLICTKWVGTKKLKLLVSLKHSKLNFEINMLKRCFLYRIKREEAFFCSNVYLTFLVN